MEYAKSTWTSFEGLIVTFKQMFSPFLIAKAEKDCKSEFCYITCHKKEDSHREFSFSSQSIEVL